MQIITEIKSHLPGNPPGRPTLAKILLTTSSRPTVVPMIQLCTTWCFLGAAEWIPISTTLYLICRESNRSILKHHEFPPASFHLMSSSLHPSFLSAIILPFSEPTIFDLLSPALMLTPTFNPLHPLHLHPFLKSRIFYSKFPPYGYSSSGPVGAVFRITPQSSMDLIGPAHGGYKLNLSILGRDA